MSTADAKRRQDCLEVLDVLYDAGTNQDVAPLILTAIGDSVSECSAIRRIMQRYDDDSEIQKWGCAAITTHASKGIEYKQQLGIDGACRLVLTAIQLHLDEVNDTNAEVIIWGCKALISLLMDSTSNRCILRSSGTEAVITSAKAMYTINQELMTLADEVLLYIRPHTPTKSKGSNSLRGSKKLMKLAIASNSQAQEEGLQQLNTIIIDMAQYFNNSELQMSACKAIHMIAQHHGNADNHIGAEGSCEAVIATILKYPTNTDIAKWGWYAVSALIQCKPVHNLVNDNNITRLCDAACSDSGIRDTLITGGACEDTSISYRQRNGDTACAHAYCEAVYRLALDSIDGKQKLVDAGTIEALTHILHRHKTSADVITVACKAVRALRAINADSCAKMLCALNEHIDIQGVAVAGCQAIHNLALNNDSNRVKLGDAGACELLAECAKTHSNNTIVLIDAFKAMDQLSYLNKANGNKLGRAKVHVSVISAMALYMGNAELVKYGCSVLDWFSCHSTTKMLTTMGNDGLCEILPKIMRTYMNNADTLILECACILVQNLAFNDDNKDRLCDAGVCKLLAKVAKVHSDHAVMLTAVFRAMDLLAHYHSANGDKLNRAKVHISAINAITLHMGNAELVKYGCAVLVELSNHGTIEVRTAMGNDGACEVLPKVIRTYINISDTLIVEYACDIVQNLALDNDNNRVKLGDAGACKLLVKVAKTHSNNTVVLIAVYEAIGQLAYLNKANGDELNWAKLHVGVINAIRLYMNNAELVEAGCAVLIRLSCHGTTEMKTTMGNDGACDIPLKVITRYINNADTLIVQFACKIVRHLTHDNDSNRVRMGDAGACELLAGVLKVYTGSETITEAACYAIGNLAVSDDNSAKLGDAGACELVVGVLKANASSETITAAACGAIHNLVLNDGNKVKLGDAGACEAIVHALRPHIRSEAVALPWCRAIYNLVHHNSANGDKLNVAEVRTLIKSVIKYHAGKQLILQAAQRALTAIEY
eukprot:18872-Heterococcus_DN1.PRE.1